VLLDFENLIPKGAVVNFKKYLTSRNRKAGLMALVATGLIALYQNATPAELVAQLQGKTPIQIAQFVLDTRNLLPANEFDTKWDIRFVPGSVIADSDGNAFYDSVTNTAVIRINENHVNDPSELGFIIAHELTHIMVSSDSNHPLGAWVNLYQATDPKIPGSPYDGMEFGLDEALAYGQEIGLFEAHVEDLISRGLLDKAAAAVANFDMIGSMLLATSDMATAGINRAHEAATVMFNGAAKLGDDMVTAPSTGPLGNILMVFDKETSVLGLYVTVNDSKQLIWAQQKLTNPIAGLTATQIVDQLFAELSRAQGMITSLPKRAALNAIKAKLLKLMQGKNINNPTTQQTVSGPITGSSSNGEYNPTSAAARGVNVSGLRVVDLNGSVRVGSVTVIQHNGQGQTVSSTYKDYNYELPTAYDGFLGGVIGNYPSGCHPSCPKPQ
jgi:hypothetical protein